MANVFVTNGVPYARIFKMKTGNDQVNGNNSDAAFLTYLLEAAFPCNSKRTMKLT